MVLIHWGSTAFFLLVGVGARTLTGKDPKLCPRLNLDQLPSVLNGCSDQNKLEKCVERNFDKQYSFCNACVIVNQESLDDSNNCLCVQCAVKALASDCHSQYCSGNPSNKAGSEREPEFINRILRGFDTDSASHFEFDTKVINSEISYYVDPSNEVYRNLLAAEKRALIHSILDELRLDGTSARETFGLFGFLKKKKTSSTVLHPELALPPTSAKSPFHPESETKFLTRTWDEDFDDDSDDESDDAEDANDYEDAEDSDDKDEDSGEWKKPKRRSKPPLVYTKTKLYTTYTPKKKTLTKWNPKIISKTIVIDECSDKRTITTVVATATDTDYETVYEPIYKLKTTTEYDTVWWGTTKTKIKHDVETLTETDYKVFTKTKYKNDIRTKTETEVEETTKYIKVGKLTITDTETDWELKWKTRTITAGAPTTKTTTATATQTTTKLSTITNHDKTRTKVRTKTMTRTKKIWNPRHTTTERISIPAGVLGSNNEVLHKNAEFGMLRVNDDPAPLLASKRVMKVRNGNSSNYSTSTIAVVSSSSSHLEPKITNSNATIVGVSGAPQAATAVIVYTTLAVSVATSMILAFSYHTNLSLYGTPEESIEFSSSDDEDNNWSDAEDVELTNDDIRSLAVQIPKSGITPEEMAQKLGDENTISLMVD